MSQADVVETARMLCPVDQDILELCAQGTPRWFIPMDNARTRYRSVDIRPATSQKGRAYRAALRLWIAAGGGHLTHRVSPKRGTEWPLGELLLPDFPTLSTAAVSMGVPGPNQKMTVQLMDSRGRVLGFAKYAQTDHARDLLVNEARMLKLLPEDVGPRLVHFARFLRGDLLVQTPLPGRIRIPRSQPDEAHTGLVERLIRPGGEAYAGSEHPYVKNLYAQADQRRGMLERIVADLGESEWPLALHHGDLSPWNMRWRGKKCLAFDWEHGGEEGMAYVEAAHAPIQVAALVRKGDPQRAKRSVSEYVRGTLPARLRKFAPAITALSALNTLMSWYPPRKPDDYESWLTTFVEAHV